MYAEEGALGIYRVRREEQVRHGETNDNEVKLVPAIGPVRSGSNGHNQKQRLAYENCSEKSANDVQDKREVVILRKMAACHGSDVEQ
jgi:hypothetical protein